MDRRALEEFVAEHASSMSEDEAIAVLASSHCSAAICKTIAQQSRLTSYYDVRAKLVAHRATPQAFALKFVHFLFWTDLVRLSTEVRIPGVIRRAIENHLLARLPELNLGQKITTAKQGSRDIVKVLLFDPSPLVFPALLINPRLREEDLVYLVSSGRALVHQLVALASDRKWSVRYAIRRQLVLNEDTPRAVAASQLRFLSARDLEAIGKRRETSVYLRRCIETVLGTSRDGGRGTRDQS